MKKGLTGILRPNGDFISCNYGNHGIIAITIPKEEELLCIYFSSSNQANNKNLKSILYLNDNITKEQLLWIIKNRNDLDETQYKIWTEYVDKSILRI